MANFTKRVTRVALAVTSSVFVVCASAHSVIVESSGDFLTGMRNVSVSGVLYDVSFQDGPVSSPMSPGDYSFQAALVSAFRTTSFPILRNVRGCSSSLYSCAIAVSSFIDTDKNLVDKVVPYVFVSFGAEVGAPRATYTGWGYDASLYALADRGTLSIATWALSAPVSAVPEPEAYALMLAGLGLIIGITRKRNSVQQKCFSPETLES